MKAYEAYTIAMKHPEFKAASQKAYKRVENGDSHTSAFHFIVNGQRFYFGYESIYDETTGENEITEFYGHCSRTGGPGAMMKPIVIK